MSRVDLAPSRLRIVLRAVMLAIVFIGAPATAQDGTSDAVRPLRIVGSGYSMPVLVRPWAAAFEQASGIPVEIVPSGTSTGPPALIDGRADIAAMTRPLRRAEETAIRERFGVSPVTIPVARDEVAIFVNAANPIERMTLAEVDAVYSRDRRCGGNEDITRWGQLGVGGDYANRAITLFGRRPGSGTATLFRIRALCRGPFKDWMRISPGQTSASLRVVESRFGIGFGSLRDQRPGMKALALADGTSSVYVRPGQGASGEEPYPLARTFDFVVAVDPDGEMHPALVRFLESVLSEASQRVTTETGYAPLTKRQLRQARERVNALREGHSEGHRGSSQDE